MSNIEVAEAERAYGKYIGEMNIFEKIRRIAKEVISNSIPRITISPTAKTTESNQPRQIEREFAEQFVEGQEVIIPHN